MAQVGGPDKDPQYYPGTELHNKSVLSPNPCDKGYVNLEFLVNSSLYIKNNIVGGKQRRAAFRRVTVNL